MNGETSTVIVSNESFNSGRTTQRLKNREENKPKKKFLEQKAFECGHTDNLVICTEIMIMENLIEEISLILSFLAIHFWTYVLFARNR